MEEMPSFADNLKRLMKDRGVSTRVITQATGIPSSTISEWTAGREPKLGEPVLRLARFFGVSLEYLVTGREPEQEVIKDLIESAEEGFMTLHQGVYRVKVEKYRGTKGKP